MSVFFQFNCSLRVFHRPTYYITNVQDVTSLHCNVLTIQRRSISACLVNQELGWGTQRCQGSRPDAESVVIGRIRSLNQPNRSKRGVLSLTMPTLNPSLLLHTYHIVAY